MPDIILASKSKVRKQILDSYDIKTNVEVSNVDEEPIKESMLKEGASPEIISKNLAELKANKVVLMNYNGINIDNKESFLMCLLGYTRYFNIPNNVPSVTGAKSSLVCGEIYEQ